MIQSKKDLKFYILCDDIARFGHNPSFMEKIKSGVMRKYNVNLRNVEYNENCRRGILKVIFKGYYYFKRKAFEKKTGWFIPVNTFGPGLCIVHIGPVIVNSSCKFGNNCRIHAMVNIGTNRGDKYAPKGGDMIYIGPGAKIFGNIELGSNIAIGANAVVNKSFKENNITLAGIPARVISKRGCDEMVQDSVKIAGEIICTRKKSKL